MRVVVTGAGGFVGRPTRRALTERGYDVTAVPRAPRHDIEAARIVPLGDLTRRTR